MQLVSLSKLCGPTLVSRIPSFLDYLQYKSDDDSSDHVYKCRIFTVDPDYFPLDRMREVIDYRHTHQQGHGMLFHLSNNKD